MNFRKELKCTVPKPNLDTVKAADGRSSLPLRDTVVGSTNKGGMASFVYSESDYTAIEFDGKSKLFT